MATVAESRLVMRPTRRPPRRARVMPRPSWAVKPFTSRPWSVPSGPGWPLYSGMKKSWPSVRTPSTSKMRTWMRRARSSAVRVMLSMIACGRSSAGPRWCNSRARVTHAWPNLLPVARVPDMAAAFLAPVAFNPDSSAMGWAGVVTVYPGIAVAIPAVVARNPDKALVWRRGDDFDGARRRWANADDDLRVGNANRQEEAADCDEKLFLHLSFSFQLLPVRTQFRGEKLCWPSPIFAMAADQAMPPKRLTRQSSKPAAWLGARTDQPIGRLARSARS